MKARSIFAIIVAVCTITGCATPYQASGLMGGYTEEWMAEDVIVVRFHGNAYTGNERATRYATLRVAQIALERGFSHMLILERQGSSSTALYAYTDGYGNRQVQQYSRPSSGVVAVLLNEDDLDYIEPGSGMVIEAAFYWNNNAPSHVGQRIERENNQIHPRVLGFGIATVFAVVLTAFIISNATK